MMVLPNTARGEVQVTVSGVELVLACTMKSLAAFEALLDKHVPHEGVPRGMGEVLSYASAIPFAMITDALACFTVDGDIKAAVEKFDVPDTVPVQLAISAAIVSKYANKSGNAEAAEATQ
jgi:hypothetical protein